MNTRKGFTLVELLVVIAILAILATVSVVGYTSFIGEAEQTAIDTDVANIEGFIEKNLILSNSFVLGTVDATITTPGANDAEATTANGKASVVITRNAQGEFAISLVPVNAATNATASVAAGAVITVSGDLKLNGTLTYKDATTLTYALKSKTADIALND